MAKLTAAKRQALPSSVFAGPGRSYPVPDKSHAVYAKAMATKYAPHAVKAAVDRKANAVLHPHKNLGGYLHPSKKGQ